MTGKTERSFSLFDPSMRKAILCLLCSLLFLQPRIDGADLGDGWEESLSTGSLRSFPTLTEGTALMDKFLDAFPDWIQKIPDFGSSVEGRDIPAYRICVSKNKLCDKPDAGKPQVMITGEHHAREPASTTVPLYFVGKLLENAKRGFQLENYLLHHRDIYLIPYVNPDGYVAIEELGLKQGMRDGWEIRKNRRPTCAANTLLSGVDLNRNYPTKWSPKPTNPCEPQEYPGDKPFSEPETQALKRLVEGEGKNIKAAVNFHAYGGFWTHPLNWAKTEPLEPEAAAIYDELGSVLETTYFERAFNIPILKYTASGESDDWFYTAHNIIAMSPEVGPEQYEFYPPASEIPGINSRNYPRTLTVVMKAGPELSAQWRWHSQDTQGKQLAEAKQEEEKAGGPGEKPAGRRLDSEAASVVPPSDSVQWDDFHIPVSVLEFKKQLDETFEKSEEFARDVAASHATILSASRIITVTVANSGMSDVSGDKMTVVISGPLLPPLLSPRTAHILTTEGNPPPDVHEPTLDDLKPQKSFVFPFAGSRYFSLPPYDAPPSTTPTHLLSEEGEVGEEEAGRLRHLTAVSEEVREERGLSWIEQNRHFPQHGLPNVPSFFFPGHYAEEEQKKGTQSAPLPHHDEEEAVERSLLETDASLSSPSLESLRQREGGEERQLQTSKRRGLDPEAGPSSPSPSPSEAEAETGQEKLPTAWSAFVFDASGNALDVRIDLGYNPEGNATSAGVTGLPSIFFEVPAVRRRGLSRFHVVVPPLLRAEAIPDPAALEENEGTPTPLVTLPKDDVGWAQEGDTGARVAVCVLPGGGVETNEETESERREGGCLCQLTKAVSPDTSSHNPLYPRSPSAGLCGRALDAMGRWENLFLLEAQKSPSVDRARQGRPSLVVGHSSLYPFALLTLVAELFFILQCFIWTAILFHLRRQEHRRRVPGSAGERDGEGCCATCSEQLNKFCCCLQVMCPFLKCLRPPRRRVADADEGGEGGRGRTRVDVPPGRNGGGPGRGGSKKGKGYQVIDLEPGETREEAGSDDD
uniref:Peptidase M14 domain-containing protein n=1 Tax=Chromera velia CCMP2878 TaxID=1169474 RepID=A0A0G4GYC6_9ALVE|eukprot:Cvel_5396.t1-p1 / transcript=Cvel_5396.t1 / gene=Cvel_5396 / organism=Chromera_velia_CCMP2878 / gene_product=Carboxypeptidase T, putative / transcript_product=Carboxypeptidase T, putative / location=Cvel_scaffold251:32452-40678(-) / protein_length=1033 / sequence_SO=supercontig / SO=protein_coding / is_pseudo=false